MLCAHTYGFVIPAAPAIFIDFSPTSADVAAALQAFIATGQIVPPPNLRWKRPADTVEYLHRATTMIHERRHFHDLLATPLGHHLFFSGVNLAITLLTTLDRRARQGVPILLPLRCGGVGTASSPGYPTLFAHTYKLFEASGVLYQEFAAAHVGGVAPTALALSFLPPQPDVNRYSEFLYRLAALVHLIGPEAIRAIALSVLALMFETPNDGSGRRYEWFLRQLDEIGRRPSGEAQRELRDMADRLWTDAGAKLRPVEDGIAQWRVRIEQQLRFHPQQTIDLVRNAIADFLVHASAMRDQVLADPASYLEWTEYAVRDWIEPLAFRFEHDGASGVVVTEALRNRRYMKRDLWRTFTLALMPAIFLGTPFDSTNAAMRALYHPWLTVQGKRRGVQFVPQKGAAVVPGHTSEATSDG